MKNKLLTGISMLIVSVCFFTFTTAAQKDSTLNQRITKTFCDEFSKKDLAKIKPDQLDMEMGLIILDVIAKYEKDIKKEWGLSIENDEDMEKIGENIGRDAALNCPAFREYVVKNLDSFDTEEDDSQKTISGKFVSLQTGQFSYISLKNKSGKEDKYWWFEHFPGADELISNPDKFKSKDVSVKYKEVEIYDALLKEYRKIKVITKLAID